MAEALPEQFLPVSGTLLDGRKGSIGIKQNSIRVLMRLLRNTMALVKLFNHLRPQFPFVRIASIFVCPPAGYDSKGHAQRVGLGAGNFFPWAVTFEQEDTP